MIIQNTYEQNGEIWLRPMLRELYSGRPMKPRLVAFKRLCDNVDEAAHARSTSLRLRSDLLNNGADEPQVWFEGELGEPPPTIALTRSPSSRISSKASFVAGQLLINYFVMMSFHPKLQSLSHDLLHRVQRHLNCAKHFRFNKLWGKGIDVGARWHEEIQAAIDVCQLGLMLVTPELLGSDYIPQFELRRFVASDGSDAEQGKIIIPVALTPFVLDRNRTELHGIEHRQIFFADSTRGQLAYSQCRDRDQFALRLFERILYLVEKNSGR